AKVSVYYDPMVAKLIVWAPTRAHAILRMRRALQEYRIVGVQTNIPFHLGVLDSIDFQRGRLDTHFVERFAGLSRSADAASEELEAITATAAALVVDRRRLAGGVSTSLDGRAAAPEGERWRTAARKAGLR
ncbi:MAG TPA: acetyl-CoA carboxylase biotin carboxylase subunit, partial [Chloroflexia bacterium]|nr:acetyl-CoA carboxylase biotin carboxylase subunit [Chloroflexia bacterium]